jgi:alpha-L-rhamnosidase
MRRWAWILAATAAATGAVSAGAPKAGPGQAGTGNLRPVELRCEHLVNPLGLDEPAPRLAWQLVSERRDQRQTAFRVLVAAGPETLARDKGDLWDTGKTSGGDAGVAYAGKPLPSRAACWWKVRVWDRDGKPGPWSAPATWSMGLLQPDDWTARWISFRDSSPLHTSRTALHLPPARHYRREFAAERQVRRAMVYASALGLYQLRLNGERVGDTYFTPGWPDYHRRNYYQAFDVTRLIRRGPNALGAIVAEGWYSGYVGYGLLVGYGPHRTGRSFYGKTPALLAQLELEYADGSRETVGTGPDWRVTDQGPVREADMLMGESYDARREMPGWDRPGFAAAGWEPAVPAEANGSLEAPFFDAAGQRTIQLGFQKPPRLEAYPGVPVRVTEEIAPLSVREQAPGVFIFDLGANLSGVVRLKARGPAGTRVRLRFGEMLHPDGRLMTENLRKARATDEYVLRGDPAGETWSPSFTYHGFQYVEVTGYPGTPTRESITGLGMHSDTPLTSSFECSDSMTNRLFRNIVRTQRANFFEVPTDCPQRDERLGWMGDAQIYAGTAAFNADVAAFFTKWLREVEESQLPNGAYPDYAPYPMFHGGPAGHATAWTDAGIICPHAMYRAYGDTRLLQRLWPSMTRFMEFRRKADPALKGVKIGNTWGDWLSLGQTTPIELIDAAYHAHVASLMSEMAAALGKPEESAGYRDLFTRIRDQFQRDYLRPDDTLAVDTQTAYVLTLAFDLAPEGRRRALAATLANRIAANGGRMATGFLGTKPLLPVLSAHGQHDLATRLFQSRQFPSWGYSVENGATSIWERWNSFTRENGFGDAGMNSFSHYAFGAVGEWMFRSLAGIDAAGPGFRRLILRPGAPTPGSNPEREAVSWVKARYHSAVGPIAVEWKREARRFLLNVQVPPNATAAVYLPASGPGAVTEGGKALTRTEGARFVRMEGDRAVLEVGSGVYAFAAGL